MEQKEQGRSMVEMLGVLAIIGVLSIGGIAGYTMAMNRYKANQILDLASKLSVAMQTVNAVNSEDKSMDAYNAIASEVGYNAAYINGDGDWMAVARQGISETYETTGLIVYANGQVESYWDPSSRVGNAIKSITGRDDGILVEGSN